MGGGEVDRRTMELVVCQEHWRAGRVIADSVEWSRCGFSLLHAGYVIRALFSPSHPYEPPKVYLSPEPTSSKHYYVHPGEDVARLCFCHPAEWSPRLNLLVAVCSAVRFINDLRAGDPEAR
jgi:hypothetical protein